MTLLHLIFGIGKHKYDADGLCEICGEVDRANG